jgi:hypothetical protein
MIKFEVDAQGDEINIKTSSNGEGALVMKEAGVAIADFAYQIVQQMIKKYPENNTPQKKKQYQEYVFTTITNHAYETIKEMRKQKEAEEPK